MGDYLASPTSHPVGGMLVLHAWWGLNEFLRSLCARLASEGHILWSLISMVVPQRKRLRRSRG
jgi:dienelactone hydrolase